MMSNAKSPRSNRLIISLAIAVIATFSLPMSAQHAPAVRVGNVDISGIPVDWASHRVVFPDPGSEQDAIQKGVHANWQKIVLEPRYAIQQLSRGGEMRGPFAAAVNWKQGFHANDLAHRQIELGGLGGRPGFGHQPPPNFGRHPVADPAIKTDWSQTLGTTTGNGLAAGQFPAKYEFLETTSSCSDYVAFPTGNTGTTQATIVAYNNIYSSCTGSPSVFWAYYTGGTGATAKLSPVISLDGTQIAYIQVSTTNVASLVILHMAASGGTVAAPATVTSVTNAQYRTCNAGSPPCFTTIALNGAPNDTRSAPFYDYQNDVMYVGDNAGTVHKFTGVFTGTPAEITGGGAASGWPQNMAATVTLTSPVVDFVSGNLFVASSAGILYRIPAGGSGIGGGSTNKVASGTLATAGSTGIVDAPVVDQTPTTPVVYVVVGDDTATGGVYQFSTTFAAANGGAEITFGSGATTTSLYDGDFDNAHYTGAGTTGNLYICGAHGGGTEPELIRVPITATFNGTAVVTDTINSITAGTCSPVTEFFNSGNATAVTTASAITTTATTAVTVASNTNIAIGNYIEINTEIMLVTAKAGTTSLTVARGQLGSTAATHLISQSVIIPAVDYIYMSVTAGGNTAAQALTCTGACLYSYPVGTSAGAFTGATAPANAVTEAGGTSGVIIDNDDTSIAGTEQIYFSTLSAAAANNGIQTSQSAP
jgi:hypothetical protein